MDEELKQPVNGKDVDVVEEDTDMMSDSIVNKILGRTMPVIDTEAKINEILGTQ